MSALSDLQSAESSAVSDQTATTSDHPHIYLYDPTVEMPSTCLPTNKQVLNRFLHLRFIEHKAEKDALHLLHEQVIEIWNRCNVETAQPKTVLNRLQLMLDPYKQLITLMKKNQYKKGMRAHYFDALERLFDIRKSQRGRRSVSPPLSPSPLPFVPISEIEKQSRSPPLFSESPPPQPDRRSKRLLDRQSKSEIPKKKPFDGFGYSSDDDIGAAPDEYSYESSIESDEDDEEYMAHQPPRTIRRHHVFSARFCEICKTRNVSVRTATQLIQTFVSEAGLPADRYMMSTSSMKRQRSRAKFSREDEVIESFRMERVIVHIDLKLIRFDDYSVNHVVVSASFGARSQVIGIRMMLDEQKNAVEQPTGADVADAVLDAINLYCVQSELVAFCCSPVPACLDFESGAMSVLRDHFPRQAALTFSCRRQMYGQVLTAVFDECFGSSFNEWDSLCTKFRNDWEQICTCKPASTVHSYERVMSPDDRDALQAEVSNCLDRDSDRELAQLCCMFLTGQFNFSFRNMRSLGNRNPRNLMIIALKMHLFRHHFILADEKSEKIYRFCSFVVFCFARFWFHAPKAIYAPNSDLTFLKLCYRYRFYDRSVADVAIYAMKKNVS